MGIPVWLGEKDHAEKAAQVRKMEPDETLAEEWRILYRTLSPEDSPYGRTDTSWPPLSLFACRF